MKRNPYVASPRRWPFSYATPSRTLSNCLGGQRRRPRRGCHALPCLLSRVSHTLRMNFASVRSSFSGTSAVSAPSYYHPLFPHPSPLRSSTFPLLPDSFPSTTTLCRLSFTLRSSHIFRPSEPLLRNAGKRRENSSKIIGT